MDDIRSTRFIFVASCVLSQGIRAQGIVRHYPATVQPVIDLLVKSNINIRQMPCPELFFDRVIRPPCQKPKYDTERNHAVCRKVAGLVVSEIEKLISAEFEVLGIVGIEFSPSCAVSRLGSGRYRQVVNGSGIFIEEIKDLLRGKDIELPFLGLQLYRMSESLSKLESLVHQRRVL